MVTKKKGLYLGLLLSLLGMGNITQAKQQIAIVNKTPYSASVIISYSGKKTKQIFHPYSTFMIKEIRPNKYIIMNFWQIPRMTGGKELRARLTTIKATVRNPKGYIYTDKFQVPESVSTDFTCLIRLVDGKAILEWYDVGIRVTEEDIGKMPGVETEEV